MRGEAATPTRCCSAARWFRSLVLALSKCLEPPYGTAEATRWALRRNGLIDRTANDVLREMEEEGRKAWAAAEESDSPGSESSGSDRDTNSSPDSSPKLPADPEWSRSQAQFEDAVGDGTYLADPDFEWEEEVEETKHGGS